jgi:hypothetical protein
MSSRDQLSLLLEKDAIRDLVTDLFMSTDERDWERVRQCFTAEVLFDMSSMGAGDPVTLKAEQITAAWHEGLRLIETVHHQIGNFKIVVAGGAAEVRCYGIASHYLPQRTGKNTRIFVGSYDLHLVKRENRWRIDQFRFNLKYVDGNPDLGSEGR